MEQLTSAQQDYLNALKVSPMTIWGDSDPRGLKICRSLEKKGLIESEFDEEDETYTFKINNWIEPMDNIDLSLDEENQIPTFNNSSQNNTSTPPKKIKTTLSIKKGDKIKTNTNRIGIIVKYCSNDEIWINTEEGNLILTKGEIVEVL